MLVTRFPWLLYGDSLKVVGEFPPTSQIGHKAKSYPTSVTNIDMVV